MDKQTFIEIIKSVHSKNELCVVLGYYNNSAGYKKIDDMVSMYGVDISHFDKRYNCQNQRKYDVVEKICPICHTPFKTRVGQSKEKTTCSRSCANTFFKHGINNGNFRGNNYKTICFSFHEYKCAVCDERNIVEVHHLDNDNKNNDVFNLIPMCPTHHQYWHSRFRYMVEPKVITYIEKIKNVKQVHEN
jgi:hypothetical protein